jgi:hypothetical protein
MELPKIKFITPTNKFSFSGNSDEMEPARKIMKGWAALFIVTNIAFYMVKNSIDKRRKLALSKD